MPARTARPVRICPGRFTVRYYAATRDREAAQPPGAPQIPIAVPIGLDPPRHAQYRRPLQKIFLPETIAGLRNSIRMPMAELIDAVRPLGGCEFRTAVAEPLPMQVFLRMLGLRSNDRPSTARS